MIVSRCGAPALSKATLRQLLEVNPHGGGLAVASAGKLVVRRQRLLSVESLQAWLTAIPSDAAVLLHLRQATCGPVDEDHVQPFHFDSGSGYAFAHNGTLPGWGDDHHSDSAAIASQVLHPLAHVGIADMRTALGMVWQPGNRFALIDATGDVELVGENEGTWRDNIWWSNAKQLF